VPRNIPREYDRGVPVLSSLSLRRHGPLLLIVALLLAVVPVAPVSAEQVAPETASAVLEELPERSNGRRSRSLTPNEAESVEQAPVESEVIEAPIRFSALGVKGVGSPEVSFRAADASGNWSNWQAVEPLEEDDGPDPGTTEARAAAAMVGKADRWVSEAIWVGESTHLQFRVLNGSLDDLDVHVIDSMGLSESVLQRVRRHLRSFGTAAPAEASSYPGLVTRRQWGANESLRTGSPSYAPVKFGVLHHTAGSNSYSRSEAPGVVRGIYHWHTQGNGWSDIGYNLLVDRYGTVYEGRFGGVERGVVGAHAAGWNSGSFGVSIMGNFEVASAPSAALTAAVDAIAWKYRIHGLDGRADARVSHNGRTIPTLIGHRDVGSTSCPGRFVYSQMDQLRRSVATKVAADSVPATSASTAWPESTPSFGAGWVPVVGDWNGDGRSTPGWYRDGHWRLWGTGASGQGTASFTYGRRGDLPVLGDWNRDGRTTIGIVRDGRWHLRNTLSGGSSDSSFTYGRQGDVPITGDWDGTGRTTVGIIRGGTWHLRNNLSGGPAHRTFTYGRITAGDLPLVGDWNRDGRDTIGIVRNGRWHLRNSLAGGAADLSFTYGRVTQGDMPITGDWNRDRREGIGIVREGSWHLRNALSGGPAQISFVYR
jgi:hypothetical protein